MTGDWLTWRVAWHRALYGPRGFYVRERPADHFRTSAHASPLFATAVLALADQHGLGRVTDVGAGGAELLVALRALRPDLELVAVDIRDRPDGLDPSIEWCTTMPDRLAGLVVANEVLDNVPCDLVEVDGQGSLRVVEVEPASGVERLGDHAGHDIAVWCARWWSKATTGDRIEVGVARDEFWGDVCDRVSAGLCVAVDYGHLRATRPATETLTSYRDGRVTEVALDGSADITAHVAMDSVQARVGGTLRSQRDVLRELGIVGTRPPLEMAATDPTGYVRGLSHASQAAELTASPGLGDHWWLLTQRP
jgi:SAM-dependent MidA family methyltransferase